MIANKPTTQTAIDLAVRRRLDTRLSDEARKVVTMPELFGLLSISKDNSKLIKTGKAIKAIGIDKFGVRSHKIASFNLPAAGYKFEGKIYTVCIGAKGCKALCYAMQGRMQFKASQIPRVLNHQILLRILDGDIGLTTTVQALDDLVQSLPKSYGLIRLHDSGDFFSMPYLLSWLEVIRRNPSILFYCYTKSVELFRTLLDNCHREVLPDNLRVVRSFGGTHDHLIDTIREPHARIFKDVETLTAAGYINANDEVQGEIATILGKRKIGLAYHGTRNATDKQLAAVEHVATNPPTAYQALDAIGKTFVDRIG